MRKKRTRESKEGGEGGKHKFHGGLRPREVVSVRWGRRVWARGVGEHLKCRAALFDKQVPKLRRDQEVCDRLHDSRSAVGSYTIQVHNRVRVQCAAVGADDSLKLHSSRGTDRAIKDPVPFTVDHPRAVVTPRRCPSTYRVLVLVRCGIP